jgi:hypothetical protein
MMDMESQLLKSGHQILIGDLKFPLIINPNIGIDETFLDRKYVLKVFYGVNEAVDLLTEVKSPNLLNNNIVFDNDDLVDYDCIKTNDVENGVNVSYINDMISSTNYYYSKCHASGNPYLDYNESSFFLLVSKAHQKYISELISYEEPVGISYIVDNLSRFETVFIIAGRAFPFKCKSDLLSKLSDERFCNENKLNKIKIYSSDGQFKEVFAFVRLEKHCPVSFCLNFDKYHELALDSEIGGMVSIKFEDGKVTETNYFNLNSMLSDIFYLGYVDFDDNYFHLLVPKKYSKILSVNSNDISIDMIIGKYSLNILINDNWVKFPLIHYSGLADFNMNEDSPNMNNMKLKLYTSVDDVQEVDSFTWMVIP